MLKQSRRCANLFLTDAIDFLKALWGIEDVIVVNQKCLILSKYKESELFCSPLILVLIKGGKPTCVLHLVLGSSRSGRGLCKLVLNFYQEK